MAMQSSKKILLTCFISGVILFFILFGPMASFATDTIKLGGPIPVTGPYASDGLVMEKALKLAVDDINKQGGLLGKQVELKIFDIGDLTPDKLQASATYLIERFKVVALINGYGGMGPDIPAFCPYDVPYIHNDATSNVRDLIREMGCTNIFNSCDYDVGYGKILFDQFSKIGHSYPNKKLAIVHGPYDWEINTPKAFAKSAKASGWDVVVNIEIPYESVQWSSILGKIRRADPSIIYIEILDPSLMKTFIENFNQNPAKNALIFGGYIPSVPAFADVIAQGAAESVLGMTLTAHMPNKEGDKFVEKWKAAYGEEPPLSIAAHVYDEVMLWANAVKQVGDATNYKAINKAIKSSKYKGLVGTFEFNDEHYIPSSDDTQPTQLFQVQDKRLVRIMIGTKKVGDLRKPPWMQ